MPIDVTDFIKGTDAMWDDICYEILLNNSYERAMC